MSKRIDFDTYNFGQSDPHIQRSCRNCQHFMRVDERRGFNRIGLRGFCVLGLGEGADWSLYISASISFDCEKFFFCEKKSLVTVRERKLSDAFFKRLDSRSSLGKLQHKLSQELLDKKLPYHIAFFQSQRIVAEKFKEDNIKELVFIHSQSDISLKDYLLLLDSVKHFFHKQLSNTVKDEMIKFE